jgi:type II secretion system protein J
MKTRVKRVGWHLQRGFTLLEIIVSMAVFTLVVAAIYSSWIAIVRGSRVALESAATIQRQRMAVRTLEEALGATQSFVADVQYYSFVCESGSAPSLSFVTRLGPSFPRSGKFGDFDVRRLTFSVEAGADSTRQLVLRQTPLLMEMDQDEKEHPVILARDVKKFEVEFLDAKSGDWIDEWTQTNQLPRLVKVSLQVGNPRNPQAPPQDEITRVVALPSIAVQASWQIPGQGGRPQQPIQPIR